MCSHSNPSVVVPYIPLPLNYQTGNKLSLGDSSQLAQNMKIKLICNPNIIKHAIVSFKKSYWTPHFAKVKQQNVLTSLMDLRLLFQIIRYWISVLHISANSSVVLCYFSVYMYASNMHSLFLVIK